MNLILTSGIGGFTVENGIKKAIAFNNQFGLVDTLKKYIIKQDNFVFIPSNPNDINKNDERVSLVFEALALSGFSFKNKIILDIRNQDKAKQIIQSADCIFLSGGKVTSQLTFLEEIGFKNLLENYQGMILGFSAGAMSLCKTVFNYPEEKNELNDLRWLKGLGYVDFVFIPHFDGRNYQIPCEIDVINEYILPQSKKTEMIGMPHNSSFILFTNATKKGLYSKIELFGDVFKIKNNQITKINNIK